MSLTFSVIIVSLNGAKRLPSCLAALGASMGANGPRTEIIVIDNGSADGTGDVAEAELAKLEGVAGTLVLRAPRNLGFAGGNNLGLERAQGELQILLNDDTYPEVGWLDELERVAQGQPDWGALGCLLLYPESRDVQHAGGIIEENALTKHIGWGDPETAWREKAPFECDYVSGAAMAIRREALEALGPLDAAYFPIYFEETDYCERLRAAGYSIWMVPSAVVLHDESQVTQVRSAGFYIKYNRNRIRFILITRTRQALWQTIKAELRWLWGHKPWDLVPSLLRAYAWNLLHAPKTYLARRRHFRVARTARLGRESK